MTLTLYVDAEASPKKKKPVDAEAGFDYDCF